jgi:2,3-bisphosphoglycerate-dependent phosphoglycerate mutase
MAIYLIRHGETEGNAARIIQLPESPLSPRGIAQAERLAQSLAAEGISRIVSSDLLRATMTAAPLQRATGAPLLLDVLLQERNFGDLRGTPYAQLDVDPFAPDYEPPNGESWETFYRRVDRAWAVIREAAIASEGHLAVVTHGLVCRALTAQHLSLPPGEETPARWENASLTIADGKAPWRVRILNSIAHLDGLSAGSSGAGATI